MKKSQKECRISANKAGLGNPNLATKGMNKETLFELMAKASLPGVGPVTIRKVLAAMASAEEIQISGPNVSKGERKSESTQMFARSPEEASWSCVDALCGAGALGLAGLGSWGNRLAKALNMDKDGAVLKNNRAFYRREWEISQGEGIRWVHLFAEEYPELLNCCTNAPLMLYVKGRLPTHYDYSLAIVGTRNMSPYGAHVLRQYMEEFAKGWHDPIHKPIVVSGLARGVDSHAHNLALECGMVTLGVMANGLATVYPAQNRGLASRILKDGALISESPANQSPDARLFASRNRIIAGICTGTLIAEAAARGGALITARYAQEYGRHVLAFPGRVTDQNYRGCLNLIMEGQALMTCSPYDLATLMQWPVGEWQPDRTHPVQGSVLFNAGKVEVDLSKRVWSERAEGAVMNSPAKSENLGLGASRVWSCMELHEPVGADQLWETFTGDYPAFVCALFELERKGLIARTATGTLIRLH
jgi:DNA protecting protein DprA